MNIHHIDKCPLCGENHFQRVAECTDHYATGETFMLMKCVNCGLQFTQDIPDESEIGRYYESPEYISHSDTHRGLMNKVYHWVRQFMLFRKSRLLKSTSGLSRGRLLDIGTGTGYFSHYMQNLGWRVKAIEKSPQARAFAQEHFGLEVFPPESLWSLDTESFDVITLWHVLEHMQELDRVGQTLAQLLHDRGILILAVPNPTSYDAGHYKTHWAAYDVPRHLWHFGPEVMQSWGQKYGFLLMDILPMPFDAFYVSMLSERYQQHSFPFVRGLWRGCIALVSSWINKERSSSLIYVFRKK